MRKDNKFNRQTWNRKEIVKKHHHPVWKSDKRNDIDTADDMADLLDEWYEETFFKPHDEWVDNEELAAIIHQIESETSEFNSSDFWTLPSNITLTRSPDGMMWYLYQFDEYERLFFKAVPSNIHYYGIISDILDVVPWMSQNK